MKILNFAKIMLLCVMTMGLASCGDDNYYTTIENSDEKLCGKTWTEKYETEDGTCTYQLQFENKNNLTSKEVIKVVNGSETKTTERMFTWKWADNSKETLILIFPANEVKYFENVWVRNHYLSGKLDGEVVTLTDLTLLK